MMIDEWEGKFEYRRSGEIWALPFVAGRRLVGSLHESQRDFGGLAGWAADSARAQSCLALRCYSKLRKSTIQRTCTARFLSQTGKYEACKGKRKTAPGQMIR
ncbi:hypothetical protein CTP10_R61200 (plasmid) [Cupriavidus sp. P-10]|uniref:hypothetical protein n=1 Tax=unclassified Cupriavidus TaxID=2640874 RepID=UPI0011C16994|nr:MULTISPECIES: hypothetical protein [unclassified Cupriavidus]BDB28709.1 hypothetical protein CTP10_R61200 [Cupriavidus sp. P-10]